nr:MAG TPA: hypothetical protein [Caudoviricetes sp.]
MSNKKRTMPFWFSFYCPCLCRFLKGGVIMFPPQSLLTLPAVSPPYYLIFLLVSVLLIFHKFWNSRYYWCIHLSCLYIK